MKILRTIRSMRKIIQACRGKVGFVPTMGYFHEGHLSLMRCAKKENELCVASVFVNPIQFGPSEDIARYPRDLKRDAALAKLSGVDVLFVPSVEEMYPGGICPGADIAKNISYIDTPGISNDFCGASRPGHFRGVTTVVGKLLNIVDPHVMYLGQKDAQQVFVITKMVADLNFPVGIKVCPTVREADGLAMSSRNKYLTPSERNEAPALFKALKMARSSVRAGEVDATKIISSIKKLILDETNASIEYIVCVNAEDLKIVRRIQQDALVLLAVRFPSARLIDNIKIKLSVDEKVSW